MKEKKPQNSQPSWAAPRPEFKGMRYVNLLRCSNLTQADTSPEGQKRFNDTVLGLSEMSCVGDIYAEGVSGSQTFNREDIQELLDLRRSVPFEGVAVYDLSRLTRGGIRHGNVIEDTLKKAGLKVISTTDLIPDGPEGDLIKSVKHYSNQLQARGISQSVARGLAESLRKVNRPAAGRNPYGLDRLYVGPNEQARILVRWDGLTQLWLRPDTQELVGQRVKMARPFLSEKKDSPKRRRKLHRQRFKGYVKQADETSRLVPGSKDRLDTLLWMFTAYFLWHWGYHRIAQSLNECGVPGPEGGSWSLKTVRSILFNPIYLGIEVRHRWTNALYNKISADGPVPVTVDQDQLEREGRISVPHMERHRDEWKLVDVPHLKDLLPSPLRELVSERVMKTFDPDTPPHPKKGKAIHTGEARQKHLDSPFVLTNMLHSKQTGHWMRGEVAYRKLLNSRKTYRYYFDGGAAVRAEKGLNIRRIPAEPVERAVLKVIQQVFGDCEHITEQVRSAIEQQAIPEPIGIDQRGKLIDEQNTIQSRMREAYKLLGKDNCEIIADQMAADSKRLKALKLELDASERQLPQERINVEEAIGNVVQHLTHLRENFSELSNADMKQLLAAMIEDLEIDLATGDLSFGIILPSWMSTPVIDAPESTEGSVRLRCPLPWPFTADTNRVYEGSVLTKLGEWKCVKPKKECYICTRKKRAA